MSLAVPEISGNKQRQKKMMSVASLLSYEFSEKQFT